MWLYLQQELDLSFLLCHLETYYDIKSQKNCDGGYSNLLRC